MPSPTVRLATEADAQLIAQVHVTGWQEAYAHLLPAESLRALRVEDRAIVWAELIRAETPTVWVATIEDQVVGWCSTSSSRDPQPPRDLEIEGIYILAAFYGTGAGQALLDAALGASPAYLWMAEDNPRAEAFYRRNGFLADGTSKVVNLLGTPVTAVRLVR